MAAGAWPLHPTWAEADRESSSRAWTKSDPTMAFRQQLGPHFLDTDGQRVLMVESKRVHRWVLVVPAATALAFRAIIGWQPLRGLDRLTDLEPLLQEDARGSQAP